MMHKYLTDPYYKDFFRYRPPKDCLTPIYSNGQPVGLVYFTLLPGQPDTVGVSLLLDRDKRFDRQEVYDRIVQAARILGFKKMQVRIRVDRKDIIRFAKQRGFKESELILTKEI